MPLSTLSAVVATAARSVSTPVTEGELLRRFIRSREEPAFAALVRRLGPMVLGVCRRVSGDNHLAEDAFQAAFVVLARRASEVHPAEAVRGWLYGVAVRTARGVRAVSARRLARETPVATVPDRAGEAHEPRDTDSLAILDEEVAGLPEHLRVAVVLCELDGLSRRDAAARLAVAEGTLSSRLAKARKLLADRLRKRGVSLPAAGLGVLATSANVSARLAAKTSALANAGAPLTPAVAALSNGVFRTMFLHKLTTFAGIGLLLTLGCFGVWAALQDVSAREPAAVAPIPRAAEAPRADVTAPVNYKDLMLVLVSKDGVAAVVFHDPEDEGSSVSYKFRYESADGKTTKSGEGKLFERRLDGGKGDYDPAGLDIVAAPIKLRWSRSNLDRGWIYYAPEVVQVHMANADDFADRIELGLQGDKVERKKLDLKRYLRK